MAVDMPINVKTFDLLTKKILECKEENKLEKILQEFLDNHTPFRKGSLIQRLFKHTLKNYESKIKTASEFSWKMPLAHMPRHPLVEEFLRSNESQFLYTHNFSSATTARSFATRLTKQRDGLFSVTCLLECTNNRNHVRITKTKDYSMTQCDNKDYFRAQIDKVKKALK
jgi:hypothetical protein